MAIIDSLPGVEVTVRGADGQLLQEHPDAGPYFVKNTPVDVSSEEHVEGTDHVSFSVHIKIQPGPAVQHFTGNLGLEARICVADEEVDRVLFSDNDRGRASFATVQSTGHACKVTFGEYGYSRQFKVSAQTMGMTILSADDNPLSPPPHV
jgi:hypothetical protein